MPSTSPHFVVLGGFLGAGKTTAMRALATLAMDMGIRVGVVTNDQGVDLVDTQVMRRCGLETREVTGGCFCCRFDALLDAAASLTSDVAPELFFAEAVGSCTDLVATVTAPLRELHGERYSVAPLSVVVDPMRARAVLGLDGAEPLDDAVSYIYRKQLEESEFIVLSKCDALGDDMVNDVGNALADAYPRAEVLAVSARTGLQMREWLDRLLFAIAPHAPSLDIDYALCRRRGETGMAQCLTSGRRARAVRCQRTRYGARARIADPASRARHTDRAPQDLLHAG